MTEFYPITKIAIVGAGVMGAGIALVAARSGYPVLLYDSMEGAANRGLDRIRSDLRALVDRGRISQAERLEIASRVLVAADLEELREVSLVVEAVVEDLAVKRDVFQRLESIVGDDCILATNTSSVSVTAIAAALRRPSRVAGFHFFNPAPVMKLVEIVSGVFTDPAVARSLIKLAKTWGKTAVSSKSTPGFIVNRVARPFYGEMLRLLEEGAADAATLDEVLTEGGGFRMGPCALMDLIGHDVNYAVTESLFNAFSGDPRYRPSLLQKDLIDAGWLGVKSGRGFFSYDGHASRKSSRPHADATLSLDGSDYEIEGVCLCRTDGRTAAARARETGTPMVLYDLVADARRSPRVAVSRSPDVDDRAFNPVVSALSDGGRNVTELEDRPGLAVMRTVAMLANEAYEAALQRVGTEDEIDQAMLDGVNYPRGPIAWAGEIGTSTILSVLDNLHNTLGDPRYRASLGLRLSVDEQALQERPVA